MLGCISALTGVPMVTTTNKKTSQLCLFAVGVPNPWKRTTNPWTSPFWIKLPWRRGGREWSQDNPPWLVIRKNNVRLDFYLSTGTVGSCLNHPRQDKTQLFRKKQRKENDDKGKKNIMLTPNYRYFWRCCMPQSVFLNNLKTLRIENIK